ncbi:MAG TPA: pyridoxal-phosphate dependent enzyme [Candidatus Deferrimicrobium sp.]|nr:pyridoxal-phosphate dependent enzyme [Candidatus Deferrimicrobium sp.]
MAQKPPLIFEEYPRLGEKLPHISLINKTDVQQLKSLGAELNYPHLYIKRDDQSTADYGGNKPRKLEFVLADAIEKKKTDILTLGGLGSNHCLATAIFSKKLNLNPVLILFYQPITADVQKKLLIFRSLDAEMLGPYGELWGLGHYLVFRRLRKNTYFLPGGGSSPLGVVGFVNAAFELKSQIENGVEKPNYVFITCGSLGTMAGLLLGFKLANLDINLIGVRVVPKIFSLYNRTFSYANAVRKLAKKTLKYLRKRDESIPNVRFQEKPLVLDEYYGGEYGKITPEGVDALELMKKTENILLDTTYTAKCFAGLINFVKQKDIMDKMILFWNTYNSREISDLKSPDITYRDLPKSFHKIYAEDLLANYFLSGIKLIDYL